MAETQIKKVSKSKEERVIESMIRLRRDNEPRDGGGFTIDDITWKMGVVWTDQEIEGVIDDLMEKGRVEIVGSDDEEERGTCFALKGMEM